MTSVIVQGARRSVAEIEAFRPTDLPAVLELLGRCSRATLYHRFHGFSGGRQWAIGLVQNDVHALCAWSEGSCLGVADLGLSAEALPELGVLVEDSWQRRDVGSALVDHLVADARADGLRTIRAEILGDDAFALTLLRRYGDLRVQLDWGVYSVEVELYSPDESAEGGRR